MIVPATLEDRRRLVVAQLRYEGEMIGIDLPAVEAAIDNHAIVDLPGDRDALAEIVKRQLQIPA